MGAKWVGERANARRIESSSEEKKRPEMWDEEKKKPGLSRLRAARAFVLRGRHFLFSLCLHVC